MNDTNYENLIKVIFNKEFDEIVNLFYNMYQNNTKHQYSIITLTIIDIKVYRGNIEITIVEKFRTVAENLNIFINYIDKFNLSEAKHEKEYWLKKNLLILHHFYNHIELEATRFEYIDVLAIQEIKNLSSQAKNLSQQFQQTKNNSERLQNQIKSQQTQYITILGIFASIVLVFVANLTFTNSIFSNAHKLDMNQLIFIGGLIALFIGNTIYALFAFIKDIVSEKKYPFKYIILFNIVIIGILLLIFCFRQPTPTSNNLEKQKQETRSTPTNKKEEQHKQEA